jgi:two-component system CheB/CheR fusion protein
VRIFGEMVALLWADGMHQAAIELEAQWNALANTLPFTLLCAYPLAGFGSEADETSFREICAHHAHVVPAESYATLATQAERNSAIAQLQHKARRLESVATENARLYESERAARDEAETANRAKDEFLAMLGHELRNPLSTLRNAVTSARFDPLRREHALEVANRGVDQLTRLVDDLLDVARITQGRITLRKRRVPLRSVVESAIEATRSVMEDRAHALTISLPGSDLQIDADATRIEQVLCNLIGNAVKYTDPGGQIHVTALQEEGDAVIRVRDNGIGIEPEMLPRIFDLFAQADRALDRSDGGLGIGLTVAKRLVEQHGGTISARSDGADRGAEFVVRLPSVVDRAAAAPTPAEEAPRYSLHVLVVEDNPDAAESLGMLLEALGHRSVVVCDGERALDAVRTKRFEMILMDIGLPGMDGYRVARRMRSEADLQSAMLVALTGYGRDEDRRRAIDSGFDVHLVKPVHPNALKHLLARAADRAQPSSNPS